MKLSPPREAQFHQSSSSNLQTLLREHLVWELPFLLCAVNLIVILLKCDGCANVDLMREN